MQYPIFPPESDWTAPEVSALPPWKGARRVGLDIETCDPTIKALGPGVRRDGWIAGYSFCIEGDRPYYVPLRHLGGGNVQCAASAMRYLGDQLANFKGELVGANLPYDLDYLLHYFDRPEFPARMRDVQIADALLSSLHRSYSLASIAERMGLTGKDEGLLREAALAHGNLDPKGEMWKLPARFVGPYAEHDARLPLDILAGQRVLLEKDQLSTVWDLESKLLPITVAMRRQGVRIDMARFDEIRRWCDAEERKQLDIVHRETGVRLENGETHQVKLIDRALQKLGIVLQRTRTGVPSVKDAQLLSMDLPATVALAKARQAATLRGTFVEGTLKHAVQHGDDWRIHATFKQMANDDGGTRFGRMSCVQPNLQNQPAKDTELGNMLRSAYLPERGKEWVTVDYSAQEPRMLLHWAVRNGCDGAHKARAEFLKNPDTDSHRLMASLIFSCPQRMVSEKQRKQAKAIFLGLCYGMGSGKLAESLSLPTQKVDGGYVIAGPEAMKLLNKFNRAVPYVGELDKLCQRQAKGHGFIRTLMGRRCLFPLDDKGRYDWTRTALNRLIQGSAADQTKTAIVAAWQAGLPVNLPIHDEINMSGNREAGEELAQIMREAVGLSVPVTTDLEIGRNWAEASEPKEEKKQEPASGGFWDAATGRPQAPAKAAPRAKKAAPAAAKADWF